MEMKDAQFNGHTIKITTERIPQEERKLYHFYYEMRHGTSQWTPLTIEHHVLVNFCGTIESPTRILEEDMLCIDLEKEQRNSLRTHLNKRPRKKRESKCMDVVIVETKLH